MSVPSSTATHHDAGAEGGEHGALAEDTLVDTAEVLKGVHLAVANVGVELDTLVVALGENLAGGEVDDSGSAG